MAGFGRRDWGGKVAALALGLVPLILLEFGLRVAGVGDYRDRPDPFASYAGLEPAFSLETDELGRETYVARDGFEKTRWFLAEKPDNGFRVFVFGGSSEAGTPYGYRHSFASILEDQLRVALPTKHVEVVNLAAPGFASRRLLHLAREAASHEPDLFILSIGHNEVVEQRLYAHLYDSPRWVFPLQRAVRPLRTYIVLGDVVRWARGSDREEVQVPVFGALAVEYWKDEPRDAEDQRYYALEMFRENIDQMIHLVRKAGGEALVLTQSKNYADWPATDSAHREGLSARELERWESHVAEARRLRASGDSDGAIRELEASLLIDDRYAETYHRLATLHRRRHEPERARERYLQAHNSTLANFGTTPARNQILRELAELRGTLFVDMEKVFEEASTDRLVGFNLFVDFLHPNLAGHQLLATGVLRELREQSVPIAAAEWRELPPLPTPESLLAADPGIHAQELRIRIVAEVLSGRPEEGRRFLEQLRQTAPDDLKLSRLESWLAGELPFDLGLMYDAKASSEP